MAIARLRLQRDSEEKEKALQGAQIRFPLLHHDKPRFEKAIKPARTRKALPPPSRRASLRIMDETVHLTVLMPAKLARLRFPKALNDRLHFLLNEQGRRGRLAPHEKKEAEGLAELARTLSILKLGAQVQAARG